MDFIYTINDRSGKIPIRAHLHKTGTTAYGENNERVKRHAINYLFEMIHSQRFNEIVREDNLEYALAAMWGDNGTKVVDLFGFRGVKDSWLRNPDVLSWDFRNGIFTRGAITCGDTLIMLGKEEDYRRRKNAGLETYMYGSEVTHYIVQ